MDIQEIRQQLADFKTIRTKGSITPESLGTILENMLDILSQQVETVEEAIQGTDKSGVLTLGDFFCSRDINEPIRTSGYRNYFQVSKEIIHLKAGQRFYATAYKLPGVLFFVDDVVEGGHVLDIYNTNSPYNIDYTAPSDCSFVVGMTSLTGDTTFQTLNYSITGTGIEERLVSLQNTIRDAKVLSDPLATTTILQVNVYDSKTQFIVNDEWRSVWANIDNLQNMRIAVQVNYASGLKVLFHATCVKPNYISLHAKAGSCELHLNNDGSFTISGTSLW